MKENINLFEEAKKSKVLLHGGLSTLVFLVMVMGGGAIGQTILGIIIGIWMAVKKQTEISGFAMGLILLLSFIVPLLFCFLWVKAGEERKLSSLGLGKDKAFIKFILGFGLGIILFSAVTMLMYVFKIITLEQGVKMGVKSLPAILILLPAWILQSSTEEILTRGWLMHVVGAKHKPIIGLVVSSVIFGLIHAANPGIGVIAILNIVLVGFMFGLYVIYTGDLWGACGIHAAWNFAQGNVFGFKVSGMDINEYSLIKFSSSGSNLLTGGEFGPEASIFATVVIGIAMVIMIIKIKKKYHAE